MTTFIRFFSRSNVKLFFQIPISDFASSANTFKCSQKDNTNDIGLKLFLTNSSDFGLVTWNPFFLLWNCQMDISELKQCRIMTTSQHWICFDCFEFVNDTAATRNLIATEIFEFHECHKTQKWNEKKNEMWGGDDGKWFIEFYSSLSAAKSKNEVKSGVLLDGVVLKCVAVLELFPGKN